MRLSFLKLGEVLDIHCDQIDRYGGKTGLRDLGLLKSALAMPQAGVYDHYVHLDIYEMAAAYLFHIVRDHPFIDGNKRVGAMSAFVFLKLNGINCDAGEKGFEKVVIETAKGKLTKDEIADFFREHSS